MSATSTLSSKFQLFIPRTVREENHWQVGQEFSLVPQGKGVLLVPVNDLKQLAGIAVNVKKDGYRDRKDRY